MVRSTARTLRWFSRNLEPLCPDGFRRWIQIAKSLPLIQARQKASVSDPKSDS
jgi:hypothetical protein